MGVDRREVEVTDEIRVARRRPTDPPFELAGGSELRDRLGLVVGDVHVTAWIHRNKEGRQELTISPPEASELPEELAGWREDLESSISGVNHVHSAIGSDRDRRQHSRDPPFCGERELPWAFPRSTPPPDHFAVR